MGTYEDLKAAIADVIYQNGNNEITGLLLQQTLLSIVNNLGEYATFAGIATPNTNPGTADQNVYYLATEAGEYINFGNLLINEGEAVILSNKTGIWTKHISGFATEEKLNNIRSNQYNLLLKGANLGEVTVTLNNIYKGQTYKIVFANPNWKHENMDDNTARYIFGLWKYYENGSYTQVLRVNNDGSQVASQYEFTGEENAYYLLGIRADIGEQVKINIEDITEIIRLDKEISTTNSQIQDIQKVAQVPIPLLTYREGYINNGVWTFNNFASHYLIPVTSGEKFIISGSLGGTVYYAFLKSDSTEGEAAFVEGTEMFSIPMNAEGEFVEIPNGTSYLYINRKTTSDYDHTPRIFSKIELDILAAYIKDAHIVPFYSTGYINANNQEQKFEWTNNIYAFIQGVSITILPGELSYNTYVGEDRNLALCYEPENNELVIKEIENTANAYVFACLRRDVNRENIEKIYFCPIQTTINGRSDLLDESTLQIGTFNSSFNNQDVFPKVKEYCDLIRGKDIIETYLFFTDPHVTDYSRYEVMTEAVRAKYISTLQKYYNSLPLDACICGGDWLNNQHTKEEAVGWLGYQDAYMRKLFANYLPLVGNHDPNPYGNPYHEPLTNIEMRNLMFRQNGGKTYYEYKGEHVRYYMLDSGLSFVYEMQSETFPITNIRWEQVEWLADRLKTEDEDNSIVMMHIYSNAGTEDEWHSEGQAYPGGGYYGVQPFGRNINMLVSAYNNRETIELNGKSYDFTQCKGNVLYIHCGHTHFDYVDTTGIVPIVCTTNFEGGYINDSDNVSYSLIPTFDAGLIDVTGNRLYLVRIGTGINRIVNLKPFIVNVGNSLRLETEALAQTMDFVSRNSNIASVNNGVVTANSIGIVGVVGKYKDSGREEFYIIKVE